MIFGWDISTSIIGVTVLDMSGSFVGCEHLDLRKMDGPFKKGDASEFFTRTVIGKYGIHGGNVHFVEERLAGFTRGSSMIQTLMTLAAFNLLVSWQIYCTDSDVRYLHPSTVKAIMRKEGLIIPKGGDKKMITLTYVKVKEPSFVIDLNRNNNPQPWCFDRADSYITAYAGYVRNYLTQDAKRKKDQSPENLPGLGEDQEG